MKTIQMTIDETLLTQVDKVTQDMGIARSEFIRRALETALKELKVAELERKHREGYQMYPVMPGEFDEWESEQAWGI